MSFKNNNANTDMDNSFEWGDYENWEEYDTVKLQDDQEFSDDEIDQLDDNRNYISTRIKSLSAPRPIVLTLTKKNIEVVDNNTKDEGKDFEEYKEVMKTKLTWLTKPTIVEYDSDDSDLEEEQPKLESTISEDDYPSLSTEIFKKNKVKKEDSFLTKKEDSFSPDWKSVEKKKKKVEKDEPFSSVEFTRPCATWIDGTKCHRKGCTYAHSEKELKINDCSFKNCNIVVEKDGYFSNKNGDRTCNKIHRHESVDNFLERLGIKKNKISNHALPEELQYALSLLSTEKYIEFEGVKHFGKLSVTNIKEEPKKKEKTQMCRSVKEKTKCPHKNNCRYAHNFNELVVSVCGFNEKCRGVVMDKKGAYTNSVDGKVCCYRHPGETKDNYRKRVRV